VSSELQNRVAQSGDVADLHATVPVLMLELQSLLGALAATVTGASDRGRLPFRADQEWQNRLGEFAYGVYLLADQTGVDLAEAVELTAQHLETRGRAAQKQSEQGWPFEG
jgi:hypothetical protein